jgi:hypothetical protein
MKTLLLLLLLFATAAHARTYSTNFASPPAPEDPISEGGMWMIPTSEWYAVRTTQGKAFGTEPGTQGNCTQGAGAACSDSTALLTGAWGPDQTVQGTIYVSGAVGTGCCQEVELRFRSNIDNVNHLITGYEWNCSVQPSNPYNGIARWNGQIGNWTPIGPSSNIGCANGDVIKLSMIGTQITVWKQTGGTGAFNQIMQFNDSSFTSGNPGIGFFNANNALAQDANYGWSSFSATDSAVPSPPAGLAALVK